MPSKSLAAQGFPRAKALHLLLFFPVLTHPCCGLLTASFFGTALRAVHPFSVSWERLAALFAMSGRCLCEYGFQPCIFRQDRLSEIAAQCAVGIADTKHGAFAVQRQAAVFLVVVGAERSDQLFDPLLLPACQFTMVV